MRVPFTLTALRSNRVLSSFR